VGTGGRVLFKVPPLVIAWVLGNSPGDIFVQLLILPIGAWIALSLSPFSLVGLLPLRLILAFFFNVSYKVLQVPIGCIKHH